MIKEKNKQSYLFAQILFVVLRTTNHKEELKADKTPRMSYCLNHESLQIVHDLFNAFFDDCSQNIECNFITKNKIIWKLKF